MTDSQNRRRPSQRDRRASSNNSSEQTSHGQGHTLRGAPADADAADAHAQRSKKEIDVRRDELDAVKTLNAISNENFKARACGMSRKEVLGLIGIISSLFVSSCVFISNNTNCPPLQPKSSDALCAHEYTRTCATDPLSKLLFLTKAMNISASLDNDNYVELMTGHEWLQQVDTAGTSHEAMFSEISNENNRLFYSDFAHHLNCDTNYAQQLIDSIISHDSPE